MRIRRGARDEERKSGAARLRAAEAEVSEAEHLVARYEPLVANEEVSRAGFDEVVRRREVARARREEAQAQVELLAKGPLPEEERRAEAELETAQRKVDLAMMQLDRCVVRSPADGVVIRQEAKNGEPYSTFTPHPLFEIANLATRRIRAEVDQRDIGKVFVGQKVRVLVPDDEPHNYPGTVLETSRRMGKKRVLRDDPAEPRDRDVMEVQIGIHEPGPALPIGLRVTVVFESSVAQ